MNHRLVICDDRANAKASGTRLPWHCRLPGSQAARQPGSQAARQLAAAPSPQQSINHSRSAHGNATNGAAGHGPFQPHRHRPSGYRKSLAQTASCPHNRVCPISTHPREARAHAPTVSTHLARARPSVEAALVRLRTPSRRIQPIRGCLDSPCLALPCQHSLKRGPGHLFAFSLSHVITCSKSAPSSPLLLFPSSPLPLPVPPPSPPQSLGH
jgi:hypothetical protein